MQVQEDTVNVTNMSLFMIRLKSLAKAQEKY